MKFPVRSVRAIWFAVFAVSTILSAVAPAHAQIESPDRRYLFREDRDKDKIEKRQRSELKARQQRASKLPPGAPQLPFDISASTLTYDSEGNKVNAEGDVLITYSSLIAEAQHGQVDIANNQAFLKGEVRLTDVTSEITADQADVDLTNGTGRMDNADIYFAEGDYHLFAVEATREEDEVYNLSDALLSTCQCPEGESCPPWSIQASSASIQQEGYGTAWNAIFRVHDVPVFYFPYLLFPVKSERQSGLLPPTIGGGRRRHSFNLALPLFLVFDESTDSTVTTVYESRVRIGPDVEFRKVFSKGHKLSAGFIYFDESARNGDLLGTDVSDLDDKEPDKNRFAGYWKENWKSENPSVPLQFIANGHYASDDLFIREYEKDEIAKYNSRFITSEAVLRSPLGETFSADLSAEYNQAIVDRDTRRDDDDIVFQRIPELTISGINSARPFGENPLGLKLTLNSNLSSVNFIRNEGYTGQRTEAYERLNLPFHFRNYFEGSVEGNARGSLYNTSLDTDRDQEPSEEVKLFEGSSNRVVPGVTSKLGTVVEKVFTPDDDNVVKYLAELGRSGRQNEVTRFKHTFEPGVRHKFVPEVDQDDNPQFDSNDRLSERNVVTYSLTQRLLARYEPRNTYLYGIEEVTPELGDLGNLKSNTALDPNLTFGVENPSGASEYSSLRRGSIQELLQFKLSQSYDLRSTEKLRDEQLDDDDTEDDIRRTSDIAADLILFPNDHLKFRARTNYDADESKFSDYSLEANALTKRGDTIITRLRFVEDEVRQLESGLELRVTDFIKLGYYSRYDDLEGEFIEQKSGVRFYSKCKCWVFDLTVTDKLNPDETRYAFNVTLIGLGQIGNTFFTSPEEEGR